MSDVVLVGNLSEGNVLKKEDNDGKGKYHFKSIFKVNKIL